MNSFVRRAYEKGYRVSKRGRLLNPKGKALNISRSSKYPFVGVWLDGKARSIYVHHLAAFCFFGESAYHAECVRHKNGDRYDVKSSNILIGTYSDNELDKPPSVRKRSAQIAARTTLHFKNRPSNTKTNKWCSECECFVIKTMFGPSKISVDKLNYRCRLCMAARERKRRAHSS